MILGDSFTPTLPTIPKEFMSYLWEAEEKPVGRTPHYTLQPGHSIRFATSKAAMTAKIINAGFRGPTFYKVAVVDTLDNHYTVDEYDHAGFSEPDLRSQPCSPLVNASHYSRYHNSFYDFRESAPGIKTLTSSERL